ncbi:MAG: hypothetical protein WDZ63_06465 [Burkholderiales bacterium]
MNDEAVDRVLQRDRRLGAFALLFSAGTLICCALPILLVTAGLGATVAAITSAMPFLVALARYKTWFFAFSGLLVASAGWILYRSGNLCPADPDMAAVCVRLRKWNKWLLWAAATVWGIGFFAAYLLLPIRIWLDN